MLFSTKINQDRFNKIDTETGLSRYEQFQFCCIQYVDECGVIDEIPEYEPPKIEYNVNVDLSPEAQEYINDCLPQGYEINGEWSGGYTLVADNTAQCPIHKHEEPDKIPTHSKHPTHGSLIVSSEYIRFRCHQASNNPKRRRTIVICRTPHHL